MQYVSKFQLTKKKKKIYLFLSISLNKVTINKPKSHKIVQKFRI